MNGPDLLAEFRKTRSENAFNGLVRQYANLVYSVALRRLSNNSQAEEAAQMVFIRLAKNPPHLATEAQLAAWLHRTTVYVAIDLWRKETRRCAREEQAFSMQNDSAEDIAWHELAPELDEALDQLSENDRQTLLLRYFQEKTMRDVGAQLGISEDAAKMRVNRALEKLRRQIGKRGIVCSAIVLGTLMTSHTVQAAPAKLVATLNALKIPTAPAGIAGLMSHLTVTKVTMTAGEILIAAALLTLTSSPKAMPVNPHRTNKQPIKNSGELILSDTNYLNSNGKPDPRKLLQFALNARKQIRSGQLGMEIFPWTNSLPTTNPPPTQVMFDGQKYSFNLTRHERTSVTYLHLRPNELEKWRRKLEEGQIESLETNGDDVTITEIVDCHYARIFDGTIFMSYVKDHGFAGGTLIYSVQEASGAASKLAFDPRTLGLMPMPLNKFSLEMFISEINKAQAKLVGEETIEGRAAWHIHMSYPPDVFSRDFWIEIANPAHVLKTSTGPDDIFCVSSFNGENPIPNEVFFEYNVSRTQREGRIRLTESSRYNVEIDPQIWTLAGLNMEIGATVIDERIHQLIGYWNGAGLSAYHLSNQDQPVSLPNPKQMLDLVQKEPDSTNALTAAVWLILNSPDGPVVDEASDAIVQHHLHSTNLLKLADESNRLRHRSSQKLLQALLDYNPEPFIRAGACNSLARMTKDGAERGINKNSAMEAERLYDRLSTEFGDIVAPDGQTYRDISAAPLHELRHASIGQSAPKTEGKDLNGKPLKLSDYLGKTIVLVFWRTDGSQPDWKNLRPISERAIGKPFNILGVLGNDDAEEARKIMNQAGMNLPSFVDDANHTIWNNFSWATYIVIDAKGIIRWRGFSPYDLNKAVEDLMK